jgi:hypothetical protein
MRRPPQRRSVNRRRPPTNFDNAGPNHVYRSLAGIGHRMGAHAVAGDAAGGVGGLEER